MVWISSSAWPWNLPGPAFGPDSKPFKIAGGDFTAMKGKFNGGGLGDDLRSRDVDGHALDRFACHLFRRGDGRRDGPLDGFHVGDHSAAHAFGQLVADTRHARLALIVHARDETGDFACADVEHRKNFALRDARLVEEPFRQAAHGCDSPVIETEAGLPGSMKNRSV